MKKIKSHLHSWNKHLFLGFSFCFFAIIISAYWGLTYAESASLLSTSPLVGTDATITPAPTTSDASLSNAPSTEKITGTNQCTDLKIVLNDNKTSYYIGETVNYSWKCSSLGTYNYISIFLQKPDGAISNINNVASNINTTSNNFDTSNLLAGRYVLKACLSTTCSPNYPSASQPFSLIAKIVNGSPSSTTTTLKDINPVVTNKVTIQPISNVDVDTKETKNVTTLAPKTIETPEVAETSKTPTSTNISTNDTSVQITDKEIADTISIISESPVLNETIKEESVNKIESSKIVKLVYQDTNKDGISDYESKYIYNIDPIKKSPTSVYEGKTINAADKILLGFDPSKKELVKVAKEEPIASTAPVVNTYKVNKVELIKGENKIVLKGQALPNSFITIYVYSTPIVVTVKTDSRGEWQYLLDKELENGTHTVYTATVNNTGNIVAQSSPYSFTKTAEAASLKDVPVAGASVGVEEPSFLNTKNIFMIAIGIILATGIILILMGVFTRKNTSVN